MAAYDVELLSLPRHVATADVARALSLGFDETATMLGRLPAIVAQRVDELDAEAIFHQLRDLGAEVRLNTVAGPPSQRPSARPLDRPPSFRPGGSSAPRPLSAAPPGRSSGPPAAGAIEPIDLPGLDDEPFELELDERGSGSLRPPAAHSEPPPGGSIPVPGGPPGHSSAPPMGQPSQPAPFSSRPPRSRAPSSRPPSSRPPLAVPDDPPLGEARGSFIGAVPFAYAYAFNPGVMAQGALTALVATVAYSLMSFGVFAIFGMLFYLGIITAYLFAIIGRGTMGKPGAPAPTEGGWDDFMGSTARAFLAFAVPLILLTWLAAKLSHVAVSVGVVTSAAMLTPIVLAIGVLWVIYLPASLILAAHGTGCLGGLNLVAGVRLIARAPLGYALLCVTLVPVVVLIFGASLLGGMASLALPFGGAFVTTALCLFPLAMGARLMGLFMYHYEYELGLA